MPSEFFGFSFTTWISLLEQQDVGNWAGLEMELPGEPPEGIRRLHVCSRCCKLRGAEKQVAARL
jgi:hypothetical protein